MIPYSHFIETYTSLTIKIILLFGSWIMGQVSANPEVLTRAFDQLFSLGLLVIFAGYMIYKEKQLQNKFEQVDKNNQALTERAILIMEKLAERDERLIKSLDKLSEKIQ